MTNVYDTDYTLFCSGISLYHSSPVHLEHEINHSVIRTILQYQPQIVEYEVIIIIVAKINSATWGSLEIEKDQEVHQKKDG